MSIFFCDISLIENKTLIYCIHYLIPLLHLSPFHPSLQPSWHTPVTGEQVCRLQVLHVSSQLRPYFPREHAKNNQHLSIESTNIVDKRGYNGLGRKLLSSNGPSPIHSKRLFITSCRKLNCKDSGLLSACWTQLRLVLMVYMYVIIPHNQHMPFRKWSSFMYDLYR